MTKTISGNHTDLLILLWMDARLKSFTDIDLYSTKFNTQDAPVCKTGSENMHRSSY